MPLACSYQYPKKGRRTLNTYKRVLIYHVGVICKLEPRCNCFVIFELYTSAMVVLCNKKFSLGYNNEQENYS